MTTYGYRRLVSNEVGRVHWVCENLEADSKRKAEETCKKNGWTFDDEILETIEAPEFSGLCKEIQRQRDRDWLGN